MSSAGQDKLRSARVKLIISDIDCYQDIGDKDTAGIHLHSALLMLQKCLIHSKLVNSTIVPALSCYSTIIVKIGDLQTQCQQQLASNWLSSVAYRT